MSHKSTLHLQISSFFLQVSAFRLVVVKGDNILTGATLGPIGSVSMQLRGWEKGRALHLYCGVLPKGLNI
jgi:hypothetical protein